MYAKRKLLKTSSNTYNKIYIYFYFLAIGKVEAIGKQRRDLIQPLQKFVDAKIGEKVKNNYIYIYYNIVAILI